MEEFWSYIWGKGWNEILKNMDLSLRTIDPQMEFLGS